MELSKWAQQALNIGGRNECNSGHRIEPESLKIFFLSCLGHGDFLISSQCSVY